MAIDSSRLTPLFAPPNVHQRWLKCSLVSEELWIPRSDGAQET